MTTRDEPYRCAICGREFPYEYDVQNLGPITYRSGKQYGSRQLMRIYASQNFKRHKTACKAKGDPP